MTREELLEKKKLLLDCIPDTISEFLYYDRKDDNELSPSDVEELLSSGVITVDEIVEGFRKALEACNV